MTNKPRAIYVDCIYTLSTLEEVRGYLATEHTEAWLVYKFSDETIRIPTHQVKMVVTTEEYSDDQ